jgi:3D (Asp-Asp-Asp) domain-containing protein
MSLRVGLPIAAIAGVSLLLGTAAWPQTVSSKLTVVQPAEGPALLVRPADSLAPVAAPIAPSVTAPVATPPIAVTGAPESTTPPSAAPDPTGQHFGLKATLYITTPRDSGKDSIGCRVIPWRTAAVDGRIVRRHTVLFIKETVGLRMPDGQIHNGYWYATDVGSAIVPGRIDLYTGLGVHTITPLIHLNLKTLTVTKVGTFAGCPGPHGADVETPHDVVVASPHVAVAALPRAAVAVSEHIPVITVPHAAQVASAR